MDPLSKSTKSKKKRKNVHLLIVGKSQEHIKRIIEAYQPDHVSLLTSFPLREETNALADILKKSGIGITTITVDPFSPKALRTISNAIINEYSRLLSIYPKEETDYFIGVTGGTNLMAIGAALAACFLGIKIHYVLKPDNMLPESREIIEIDMQKSPKECKRTTSFCT